MEPDNDHEIKIITRETSKISQIDSGFKESTTTGGGGGVISDRSRLTISPPAPHPEELEDGFNALDLPLDFPQRKHSTLRLSLAGQNQLLDMVAEKKRLKTLERQRKLVDRLKAGEK